MFNNARIENVKEIAEVYKKNDEQREQFNAGIAQIESDMQIRSMQSQMCDIVRKALNIEGQDDDTVEEKRFSIKAAVNERSPYTLEVFKNRLNECIGKDRTNVTVENGTLIVKVALESKKKLEYVKKLTDNMVPLDYLIDIALLWNQYSKVEKMTYAQLSNKTYKDIREEVL